MRRGVVFDGSKLVSSARISRISRRDFLAGFRSVAHETKWSHVACGRFTARGRSGKRTFSARSGGADSSRSLKFSLGFSIMRIKMRVRSLRTNQKTFSLYCTSTALSRKLLIISISNLWNPSCTWERTLEGSSASQAGVSGGGPRVRKPCASHP